jgi:toxin YoeB
MVWKIEFSRNALKDVRKLKSANLEDNVKKLVEILKQNPYASLSILIIAFKSVTP